ncbi:hypothetical protein TRFO_41045 [Tritrichomonas foetus]|nr:hypothetical protein TRFO_41045 [Tritrichomonas foetus]|eukprot:OHT17374.1 hypothetical protein TRFO_41045 [Tritrichomonas foetus]
MHYDSLINLRQTNLLGNSQIGVLVDDDFENIVFGSKSIRLGEFELDRSMNKVGELSVIQNSDDFILQLSLDDSAISDKKIVDLTVQMMKGTKVEFSQGFSEIQSGKVTIDAIDAKIYVDDKVIPSVIDYNPSNVIIVINGKGGVSPGIIVLIVILVIAIVAAIVSLIVYFGFIRRRKLILDAYDNIPDLATDGANDKISMLAQNNEVL